MACFIISPHSHLFLNSPHQPFGHTNLATALPISDSPFMAWQPLNLSSPTNPLLKPSTWRPYVPDSSLFFNGKNKLGQNNKIIPMTHLHIVLNWRETLTKKRIGGKHSPTRILLLHNPPRHWKPKKKKKREWWCIPVCYPSNSNWCEAFVWSNLLITREPLVLKLA